MMLVALILTIVVCNALIAKAFNRVGYTLGSTHRRVQRRSLLDGTRSSKYLAPRVNVALSFKVSESDEVDAIDQDVEFDEGLSFGDGRGGLLRKLSRAAIPVAASIGFAVSPSSSLASRLAAAAIGGGAGLLAKVVVLDKIIASIDSEIAADEFNGGSGGGSRGPTMLPKAVQTVLAYYDNSDPPVGSYSLEGIERIAKKNGVKSNDLALLFTHLFAQIIYNSVQNESDDLTELSDVVDFASTIGLSTAEIGDGFALAAVRLGRTIEKDERGFYSSDYDEQQLLQAAKMFFLGDKMIGSSQGYYGKRLLVALQIFTSDMYKDIISASSKALFKKCVESVIADPESFNQEEIGQLKDFLSASAAVSTLRPANMQNLIMEAVQLSVDNAIARSTRTSKLGAEISNMDNLKSAQTLLGWNNLEFEATVETRSMPVFEAVSREIVQKVVESPETASELAVTLAERVNALGINRAKAKILLTTLISEQNSNYMSKIDKVYGVSGRQAETAYKVMVQYAATFDALKTLTAPLLDGADLPVPGLPFAEMVRVSLYEMKLAKKNEAISNDMFSLNEKQRAVVAKTLSLPKVCAWVSQCVAENNLSSDARAAYQKLLDNFGVTAEEWGSTAVDYYYQEVQRVASTRAVPSDADMRRLNDLKEFLQCPPAKVTKVHLELLGDKYLKAVKESMTPGGVIAEEYLDGLERLRSRLQLSKEDALSLFGLSIRDKLIPTVKEMTEVWKSDTDETKRREKERAGKKDKSGDPISSPDNVFGFMETGSQKVGGGPNVFMRESLNLVDFYVENYLQIGVDVRQLATLPVTAAGVLAEGDSVGLFKHYLITRLAETDPALRTRYINDERVFGSALGITEEGQARVKESLMYVAYKNMLKRVLQYKDAVEASDLAQFSGLKESLLVEQAVADKVFSEASKGAIIEHAAGLMRVKDGPIVTSQMAQRLRGQVQSLGYDMQKDAGFNDKLITYLYALEVQSLVEGGLESDLREVQEAYDIPEERAAQIIEASCRRYVSQLFNLALRSAKKYDEKASVGWVAEILKYAPFISTPVDADGNIFMESDKVRMIEFYVSNMAAGGADVPELVAKLKFLCNLTESYVPPIEGIDGLLDLDNKRVVKNLI